MNSSIALPLLLTLLAGLATGIGSAIAFFAHRTNVRFLSFSLGLSAGVMIYVSFVELFAESQTLLAAQWGPTTGVSATVACFFGGILLIGVIDRLVPSFENPHEMHSVEEMNRRPHNRKLMRMGLMTALVIGIHNFPEGIATFMSALDNPTLGIAIAAAIAIHNIPEGIAVSIPIYYATGSRRKAFLLSLSSGLAEPVGALLAYAVPLADAVGLSVRVRRGHHGLHFARRAAARRRGVRRAPYLDLRRGDGHGRDGRQPDLFLLIGFICRARASIALPFLPDVFRRMIPALRFTLLGMTIMFVILRRIRSTSDMRIILLCEG